MDNEEKLDEVYRASLQTSAILPDIKKMVESHDKRLDEVDKKQAWLAGCIAAITTIGAPILVFLLNK